eukprot:TRINITY_DN11485_c0_g1_i1.p1 TRINITY_DN11485_c0_g1~~TRINITY_DN11485_c0_g1_i1.p1  ORF type:complete len:358 (+),score=39.86 TRINITY_DN11485_c0_g1_i1:44-1117(+)
MFFPWQNNEEKPINALRTFQTKHAVVSLKQYADLLITSSDDNKVRLWSVDTRTGDLYLSKTFKAHRGGPASQLVAHNQYLYTSSTRDRSILSYDLQVQEPGTTFEGHTKSITDISVDPTNKPHTLVSASFDGSVRVWDSRTGGSVAQLLGHTDAVTSVKLVGGNIVSSSADHTLKIWDKRRFGQALFTLQGHDSYVFGFQAVKDKNIISYSRDGSVKFWRVKNGEEYNSIEVEYPISHILTDPLRAKKSMLVIGHNSLETYSTKGKKMSTFENVHSGDILCSAFYDSDYFFTGSVDRTICLWGAKKGGNRVAYYSGHQGVVNSVVVFREWIYSCSSDGSIRQWVNVVSNERESTGWI